MAGKSKRMTEAKEGLDRTTAHSVNDAVKVIIEAINPLGDEYCEVLERGLHGTVL